MREKDRGGYGLFLLPPTSLRLLAGMRFSPMVGVYLIIMEVSHRCGLVFVCGCGLEVCLWCGFVICLWVW